jgi:hypothetical protein
MMQTVRLICWLVLPVGLLFANVGGAAAQGTPEQRQACTPDAIRLCSDFIPDVPKITKCMKAKYKELSEPCRLAMRHKHTVHRHYQRKKPTECYFPGAC